jgi:tetratricopeptide (TPR) repeat protein
MLADRYGNALSTGSAAARDAYVEGCDLLLGGNAGPERAFARAVAADPDFALAHIGQARSLQLRGDAAPARAAMDAASALSAGLPPREASHLAFYDLVLSGRGADAVLAARRHLTDWPRDAMVLSPCTSVFGLIGFSGRPGREQEQVQLLDGLASHYGGDDWWFNTQHAFALLETGQLAAARPLIENAMAQHPRNAHGAHVRAHLLYEEGNQAASLALLRSWMEAYPREGQLHCHISWHMALCELEAGDADEAFRIYLGSIAPGASWGPAVNTVTDAVSFLWRAELAGHARDPTRWQVLQDFGQRMFPRPGIAFADAHIALADAVTGNGAALDARMRAMEELEREGRLPSGPVVPALSRAFAAFLRQDFSAAIEAIEPVLDQHERIGGSRAQRDLVEFTLLKAYVSAGRPEAAQAMLCAKHRGPVPVPLAGLHPH